MGHGQIPQKTFRSEDGKEAAVPNGSKGQRIIFQKSYCDERGDAQFPMANFSPRYDLRIGTKGCSKVVIQLASAKRRFNNLPLNHV